MNQYLAATIFAVSTLLGFAPALRAQSPINPAFQSVAGLGNTVVTDRWTNFSGDAHPGYPGISGSEVWPAPIGPDTASGRQALFRKQTGADADTTDFLFVDPFGGGIYSFNSNTRYELFSGAPLANLDTLQLQLSMEGATSGMQLTLATTAGTFTLAPTSTSLLDEVVVNIPGFGETPIDLTAFQWNLSAYAGTITGVTLDWSVDQHTITYGQQLAQASQQVVPEPGGNLLMAFGGLIAVLRFRSRMRRVA